VAKKKPGAGPGSSYALLGATTRLGIWPRRARLNCRRLAGFHPLVVDSVFTLCSHGLMGHVEDDLPFRVEQWDASGARFGGPQARPGSVHRGRPSTPGAAHYVAT